MSDSRASSDPVEQFRAAVADAFGAPWRVERTETGFVAAMPVRASVATDGVTFDDEVRMTVDADQETRRFGWSTRRVAGFERDVTTRSLTGARRDVDSARYTGSRRTWTFRRTPEGLVPKPEAPEDSAGREADLRRVAAGLGWTEVSAPTGGRVATSLPPKKTLILMGVFAAVVVLFIVGIGGFVIANVLGTFTR